MTAFGLKYSVILRDRTMANELMYLPLMTNKINPFADYVWKSQDTYTYDKLAYSCTSFLGGD